MNLLIKNLSHLTAEQRKISKLIYSWNKQKKLYNQMIIEKDNYYNSIVNKVINGGKK